MRRILYAGGEFFTDDSVADALMAYASVLAIVNSADVVAVPGFDENGEMHQFSLIIGPASQILSMDSDAVSGELDVQDAIEDLHDRARRRLPDTLGLGGVDAGQGAETDAESVEHPAGDSDGGIGTESPGSSS